MRSVSRLVILVAVFALAVGCARKPAALLGGWQIDVEKTLATMRESDAYKKAPDAAKKGGEEAMRAQMAEAMLTFSEKQLTMSTGKRTRQMDYKVTAQDGDRWTLETSEPGKSPETVVIAWTDNDHLSLTPPGKSAKPIFLIRAGAAAAPAASPSTASAPVSPVASPPSTGVPASGLPGGPDASPAGERKPLKERLKEKVKGKVP